MFIEFLDQKPIYIRVNHMTYSSIYMFPVRNNKSEAKCRKKVCRRPMFYYTTSVGWKV